MNTDKKKYGPKNPVERSGQWRLLTPEPGPLVPVKHSARTPNPELRWYVVQSKPREELRAQHFLREKGFHTYLPRMEVERVIGVKRVTSEKPLFPGYLFCRFIPEEDLAHVRWTRGVFKILPESVNPSPVKEKVVASIQSLEQRDGVIRKKPLTTNDPIRVTQGPMKDILGIFDHWASDRGRVRVLLNFMHYQATVELHHSLVEKVA